jgi:hypothetical protein
MIACLNEPGPLSLRLVTVKLATGAINGPLKRMVRNPPVPDAARTWLKLKGPINTRTIAGMRRVQAGSLILIYALLFLRMAQITEHRRSNMNYAENCITPFRIIQHSGI